MNKVTMLLLALVSLISAPVFAAIPIEATTAFTELGADATTMIGLGWVLAVIVVGGLVVLGLFKKIASRAAGR
jgi:hypothetical protein